MADGEAIFRGIGEILGRRYRISDLDPGSGALRLHDEDHSVRVVLEPDLLAEYFDQLDEHNIPDLAHSPHNTHDQVRTRYVVRSIEEFFESDLELSLLEIRLDRSADGRISLTDRRGAAQRPFPSHTEGGYWSSS